MSEIEKKPVHALWQSLQQLTQARIAIGRTGDAQPTSAVLAFEVAQAQARDAVHCSLDAHALSQAVEVLGFSVVTLQSAATDRAMYLRRPDAGRRLSDSSRAHLLRLLPRNSDGITVIVADGLSAAAPMKHAVPLLAALMQHAGLVLNPVVFIATEARVALGDEIGELVRAQAVLTLIGERPGLSTPESLGAYLTWNPHVGCTDAERNCVSNIHWNGLSYAAAAQKLALLFHNARLLGATGVDLHDEEQDGADGESAKLYPPEEC
jgi:ethanolamine ammonia-lyase small subunit